MSSQDDCTSKIKDIKSGRTLEEAISKFKRMMRCDVGCTVRLLRAGANCKLKNEACEHAIAAVVEEEKITIMMQREMCDDKRELQHGT